MKKTILKFTTISLIATALGSTAPATATERLDLDSAKPYLIGATALAVVGFTAWLVFGKKEQTPSLTREQVTAELAPLKQEIEALKRQLTEAQRAEALQLIKDNMKDADFLALLKELIQQNTNPSNGALQIAQLPESPRPAPRKMSIDGQDFPPSPAKRLDDREKKVALSQHQQGVKWAVDKEALSERLWSLLAEDNDASQAVFDEINSLENREATYFDFTFKNANGCKLVITIDSKRVEKRVSFKK